MILRKPYAFIIRHFRMIHLILLGCMIYMLSSISSIYRLFGSLQKSSTYIYAGAYTYIDKNVYTFIIIALFLSAVLFWLLKEKKKPTLLYIAQVIYLIVLSVGFGYLFSVLTTLQNEVIDADMIIFCKDISLLLSLPSYVFIAICFIRGIGFNLKQFNFSKDIKELQIADQDSAEFELLIGQNNYKYLRTIRRTIRETKYYVLENKFAFTCIAVVVTAVFIGYGIKYYNQYMKRLSASEVTTVDSVSYIVNRSYITGLDYNGKSVNKGYKYVVVDMKFYNSSSLDKTLDLDHITLADGKIVYYPTITKNGKFYDLGVPYLSKKVIKPNQELLATLAFEIPASVKTKNFTLRVQYGLSSSVSKVIPQYRKFSINALNIDTKDVIKTNELNETINIDTVGRNKFSLTIKDYKLMDAYNNRYVICSNVMTCRPISNVIKTTQLDKKTMLVVDYSGTIYEDANFTKTFNTYNKIFENYVNVNYSIYNKDYQEKAKVVVDSYVDGKVFLVVDRRIYDASSISLEFNFRNDKFIVPLKKKTT